MASKSYDVRVWDADDNGRRLGKIKIPSKPTTEDLYAKVKKFVGGRGPNEVRILQRRSGGNDFPVSVQVSWDGEAQLDITPARSLLKRIFSRRSKYRRRG